MTLERLVLVLEFLFSMLVMLKRESLNTRKIGLVFMAVDKEAACRKASLKARNSHVEGLGNVIPPSVHSLSTGYLVAQKCFGRWLSD